VVIEQYKSNNMGGMLSQPVTSKLLERGGNSLYRTGRTDMQGYRLNMEDAMTCRFGLGQGREDWGFFGVFDGHAGKRASMFLEEHLHKRVAELADPFNAEQLQDCVCKFDAEFCSDPERRNDGSTCVFAIIRPCNSEKTQFEIVVSNTGDSRVVIIRKSDNDDCVAMTSDHKPEDAPEHARIIAAGGTVSMNRTDGQLAMSRAIGDYQYKMNVDLEQNLQKVIPLPDITFNKLSKGDAVLIMCDGIVEQMSNEDAAESVTKSLKDHNDPALACADLFTLSLERGSKDNHSSIIVILEDGSGFGPEREFVAGPYHPFKNDHQFAEQYIQDAERHGVSGEPLFELARKTEAKLGPFEEVEQPSGGSPAQYMRLLEHIKMQYNMNAQLNAGEDNDAGGSGPQAVFPVSEGGGDDDDDDDDDDNEDRAMD
jgi:serine/threonine protein phosphatase PrpC